MKPFRAGRVLNAYTPNIPWRPQVGHAQPRARVAPAPIQTAVDRSRQEATRASRFRKNSWSAPDRGQQATYREEMAGLPAARRRLLHGRPWRDDDASEGAVESSGIHEPRAL